MKINIPTLYSDESSRNQMIQNNHLEGWFYTHLSEYPELNLTTFKDQWLKQINLNHQQHECWLELVSLWPTEIAHPVLIKGMALERMGLYAPGERFKSDIDFLANENTLAELENRVLKRDGRVIKEKKWWGNSHKKIYSLQFDEHEVVLEGHQQLFFHIPHIDWQKYRHTKDPFLLEDHAHLLFLMGHFVFQHNCLNLYWLLDIALWLQKNDQWDFSYLEQLATRWQLKKSLIWSLNLSEELLKIDLRFPDHLRVKIPVDIAFAVRAKQTGLRYFMVKHMAKDSLWTALKYDLLWGLKLGE